MKPRTYINLALMVALAGIAPALAQSPEPIESLDPAQPPASPEASRPNPAPGEEVMRPTQRGLRLTLPMARGIGRVAIMEGKWKDLNLTDDQQQRLAGALAGRMVQAGRHAGQEGQAAVEFVIETALQTGGIRVTAENCREYGQKLEPLARMLGEITNGFEEDSQAILDPQQLKKIESELNKGRQGFERFARRLQDYREGKVNESENPFEALNQEEQAPKQSKVNDRVQNAQRMADWDIQRAATWEWSRFLAGVAAMFKLDEAQKAKGQAVLAEYRKKAEAVQTPEWKARVRRNRTLANLVDQLADAPHRPWVRRLEQEYKEANRPLVELGDEYRKAVLALVTPEQRTAAFQNLKDVFAKHGTGVEEADLTLLQGLLQ